MADKRARKADFTAPDEKAWRALIEGTPADAAAFERLVSHTADGLTIAPLYYGDTPPAPDGVCARAQAVPWTIMQRIDDPDAARAREQIKTDLDNGATGLVLVFSGALGTGADGERGMRIQRLGELQALLADVDLRKIRLRIDGGRFVNPLIAAFLQTGKNSFDLTIEPCIEPMARFARRGVPDAAFEIVAHRYPQIVAAMQARGISRALLCADLRIAHGAGASEAQELGIALATLVQYMRWCDDAGLDIARIGQEPGLVFAADADQFLVMAKMRAARLLWARLAEAMGLSPSRPGIHAETAWRMMSTCDVQTNLLRTTMAAFSAGLGGADHVTVLPHTAACGLAAPAARRLARNIQLILQEESGLARVADPAAGTGVIESLTDRLCHRGWAFFQEIERQGGLARALREGMVQTRIAAQAQKRRAEIATGQRAIVGVSLYPKLDGVAAETLDMPPPAPPVPQSIDIYAAGDMWFDAAVDAICDGAAREMFVRTPRRRADDGNRRSAALVQWRDAQAFERLRHRAREIAAKTGHRPTVFLASLGPPEAHGAAAGLAREFFAAGGIDVIANDGFANVTGATNQDALIGTYKDTLASCACICGSRAHYDAEAANVARQLKDAGAKRLYMVQKPQNGDAMARMADVDTFLFAGCDMIQVLGDFYEAHALNP